MKLPDFFGYMYVALVRVKYIVCDQSTNQSINQSVDFIFQIEELHDCYLVQQQLREGNELCNRFFMQVCPLYKQNLVFTEIMFEGKSLISDL